MVRPSLLALGNHLLLEIVWVTIPQLWTLL
jgi:hypothetical protein